MTNSKIRAETLNELYNLAEEVFGNISLIKAFCKDLYDTEDFYKLKYILNYTHRASDLLYAKLADMKSDNKI